MKTNLPKSWKFVATTTATLTLVAMAWFWQPARESLATLVKPVAAAPSAQAASGERKILYYEDPMHPWYRSDKPGIAPDCGMKLVPVYAEQPGSGTAPTIPGGVQISAARQQLLGLTTAQAEYRPLEKVIRTVGRVALDEERIANVHIKVSGWIQKVFVDYTFQHVMKGDPLFTLYSPELLASEQEYLLALKAEKELGASSLADVSAGGKSLKEAARRRLELWDLTDEQIRELEQTGKPQREITFYAPASGHVLERKAFPNQYITPDTELYKIADHSEVWVYADIYEAELPLIELGQEATLTAESLPGQELVGHIAFIQPHLMDQTRTLPVRVEFPNPDLKLKPGMFVNVEIRRALGRQLTVPVDAVLDSGERQRVFVARADGVFEPREVKLGERTEDYVAIVKGLRAGEKVVTRANFLVDSESNLRQAIAGMAEMPGMKPASPAPQAAPSGHEGHDMAQPAEKKPVEHRH
ncbi:MAG: efflux RND transporter periplasmic adaptor subunit [Terriglobia bacterium]